MRRSVLVLTVGAMILAMVVSSLALPALAQDGAPPDPNCDWYLNRSKDVEEEVWWEYWCWWPGWGWEFVFWVWADLPDEDVPPKDEDVPPEDEDVPPDEEDSPPEDESWPWPPEDWPWPPADEDLPPKEEA